MRVLLLILALALQTGCTDPLEKTLEQIKPGEPFPKEAVDRLPEAMRKTSWTVKTIARATSEHPLVDGGKLCRAGAYLLEGGEARQIALITLCGGAPVPTQAGDAFLTFPPAASGEARTRLDLLFPIALGPQRELVWLTERTLLPPAALHLHERAWRVVDGKLAPVLDHVVSDLQTTRALPEEQQRRQAAELAGSYAAGFTGAQFPLPFTMTFNRRGQPTTVRLSFSDAAGYTAPPLIPGTNRPPVSASPSTGTPDGGAP